MESLLYQPHLDEAKGEPGSVMTPGAEGSPESPLLGAGSGYHQNQHYQSPESQCDITAVTSRDRKHPQQSALCVPVSTLSLCPLYPSVHLCPSSVLLSPSVHLLFKLCLCPSSVYPMSLCSPSVHSLSILCPSVSALSTFFPNCLSVHVSSLSTLFPTSAPLCILCPFSAPPPLLVHPLCCGLP